MTEQQIKDAERVVEMYGDIMHLAPEQQKQVFECARRIRANVAEFGVTGKIAVALVLAETLANVTVTLKGREVITGRQI